MKNCPFCGASIPDGASFCVYCMRELAEKETGGAPASGRKKKRVRMICLILAGVMLFAAGTGTGVLLRGCEPAEVVWKDADQPLEPDPDDPRTQVYATVEWFRNSSGYYHSPYGHEEFAWEPWNMTLEWTNNTWACYSCPAVFRNERPRIYFKLDGTEILVALLNTNADESIYVSEVIYHLSQFIYVAAGRGYDADQAKLYDFTRDASHEPSMMNVANYSILERLHIEKDEYKEEYSDLSKCVCLYTTTSFPEFGEDNRVFHFYRSRYQGGEYVGDYFLYFTFGDDKIP